MNTAILATFETWQMANSSRGNQPTATKSFFVCEVTRQVVLQCLSVLPTNPIHTPGRQNTGVHQHVNFTGGSNPAPKRQKNKKKTNRQRTTKKDSQTARPQTNTARLQRRKVTQKDTCQQTYPINGSALKCTRTNHKHS